MPFDAPLPETRSHWVLRRDPAEGEATWLRVHPPAARQAGPSDNVALYRVELLAGGETYGSLWGMRPRTAGNPHLEESRLMATAADQVAQSLRRQRLADAAAELEIARRSDELKSALLDSVSHDLRTPLATMRAAAGTLADPSVPVERAGTGAPWPGHRHRSRAAQQARRQPARHESGRQRRTQAGAGSASALSCTRSDRGADGSGARWTAYRDGRPARRAGPVGRLGHARPGPHQSARERGQVRRSGRGDSGAGPSDRGPADAAGDRRGRREWRAG